jgi:hypothetical protein
MAAGVEALFGRFEDGETEMSRSVGAAVTGPRTLVRTFFSQYHAYTRYVSMPSITFPVLRLTMRMPA